MYNCSHYDNKRLQCLNQSPDDIKTARFKITNMDNGRYILPTTDPGQASKQDPTTKKQAVPKMQALVLWGYCLLLSTLFLLIATKSSPLYPLNDWTDPNTFFTMGKGMMNGAVPYRDLFEHKGPLLFLIHGFAYLISSNSFLGVYMFEVIAFTIFLFFSHKTLTLFVNKDYSIITLPFIATAILNLRSFAHGDTAEEFTLPFMMISLYYLIKYFKEIYPEPIPHAWLLVNGILAGCILWIKFTFLGFWIGWTLAIGICLLVSKQYLHALKASLSFLSGMLLATLPWVVYFGVNHALSDWFHTYFTINLTTYAEGLSIREIIRTALLSFRQHLSLNPITGSILSLGTILFLTNDKFIKRRLHRLGLLACASFLGLGVYGGGKDYIYYFLIFSPFVILGFIILSQFYADAYGKIKSKFLLSLLIILSIAGSFAYTLRFNRNVYMLDWQKADMVQYKFAAVINQSDDPTLLNYGFQDGGFYTISGIIPNIKYFQKYNFTYGEFPINMDEQNRYIEEQLVEFVVIRMTETETKENLTIPYLFENYELIETETQVFGETEFIYLLFKRLDSSSLSLNLKLLV